MSGRNLTLTDINPGPRRALETKIVVRGASIVGDGDQILGKAIVDAQNNIRNLDIFHPESAGVAPGGGKPMHPLAAYCEARPGACRPPPRARHARLPARSQAGGKP